MKLSVLPFVPVFFDRYLEQIPEDVDLLEGFERYGANRVFQEDKMTALGERVYAPGKWTAAQILQHCIDTERILAYRALCIGRGETQSLPGFDENAYAAAAPATRSISALMQEYVCVQQSSRYLFSSFSEEVLSYSGTANGVAINVAALGFAILGHGLHHQRIFEERYFPLIG